MSIIRKRHTCIKTLKFATVPLLLLVLFIFCPGGGSRFYQSRQAVVRMKARRLYAALERLRVNGQNLWPQRQSLLDGGLGLQRKAVHASSVAYFSWLYRMEDYGTQEWKPRIVGLPISLITFDDAAKEFTTNNVMWSIAEGVDEETPGWAVVLVSANVDCSNLLSSYDGNSDFSIVTKDGKPAIVVRRDGAVEQIDAKYLKAQYLYRRHAFSGGPKSYLTPQGRVWTRR